MYTQEIYFILLLCQVVAQPSPLERIMKTWWTASVMLRWEISFNIDMFKLVSPVDGKLHYSLFTRLSILCFSQFMNSLYRIHYEVTKTHLLIVYILSWYYNLIYKYEKQKSLFHLYFWLDHEIQENVKLNKK